MYSRGDLACDKTIFLVMHFEKVQKKNLICVNAFVVTVVCIVLSSKLNLLCAL